MDRIIKEKIGYSYQGEKYRSKEEIYFSWYLDDIKDKTKSIKYEPFSMEVIPKKTKEFFDLKKDKNRDCFFLNKLSYTPDFVIEWNYETMFSKQGIKDLWCEYDIRRFKDKKEIYYDNLEYISYIEIKGGHSKHNTNLFPVKQKIIYDRLGIYVQKIVPKNFFKAINYYPERYLLTDGGQKKRKL